MMAHHSRLQWLKVKSRGKREVQGDGCDALSSKCSHVTSQAIVLSGQSVLHKAEIIKLTVQNYLQKTILLSVCQRKTVIKTDIAF